MKCNCEHPIESGYFCCKDAGHDDYHRAYKPTGESTFYCHDWGNGTGWSTVKHIGVDTTDGGKDRGVTFWYMQCPTCGGGIFMENFDSPAVCFNCNPTDSDAA